MIRQACSVDSDCPDYQRCVDGVCVDINGGNGGNGVSTKEYQFWRQYRIPPYQVYAKYIDGVYIDGDLFQKNIPVVDGVVHLTIAPQSSDDVYKWAEFRVPTFANGVVGYLTHKFVWLPSHLGGGMNTQSFDLDYAGNPYGMGLNTICVELSTPPPLPPIPISHSMWFNVLWKFSMEVG